MTLGEMLDINAAMQDCQSSPDHHHHAHQHNIIMTYIIHGA